MSTAPAYVWDPKAEPVADSAVWRYVCDLPVPPDLARVIETTIKQRGGWWMSRWERAIHEEQLRMQYHFGGKAVLYIQTPRGLAIIASGPPDLEDVGRVRNALPPSVRAKTTLYYLDPWSDHVDPNAPTTV